MRILISRFAQEVGGAEKSFFTHIKAFEKLGHEVIAYTNLPLPEGLGATRHDALWFRSSGKAYKLLVALPQLAAAWWLVVRTKPDVINAHSRFDQVLFTLLKPFHRRPVVWKDPAEVIQHIYPRSSSRAQKLYLRAIHMADAICELSEAQRQDLLKVLPEDVDKSKIVVIHSGIDFSSYDLEAKPAIPKTDGVLTLGYIARLHPAKGIRYLIEGFAVAKKSVPGLRLVIVGDGEHSDELKVLVDKEGVSNYVEFIPYQKDVSAYLRSFDIYICPSLYESWGLGVHEARLFGLPIVATKVGGIPEQVKDGESGILVEPKDARSIAWAIIQLAKDPSLAQRLGDAAAASARKQGDFSDTVREKLVPLFEEAILK